MTLPHTTHATVTSPVRNNFLPFNQPDIKEAEIAAVTDTLHSGWLTTGPKTIQFEEQFAAHVQAQHALAVNSCTGGLHVALTAANIGPGDEVIVPTITFCATANVVVHVGATPVLVDVEPDTLNINPAAIEAAITPRTKAIIPVHLYGHPCDMPAIMQLARTHNLLVIDDAAHAVGGAINGLPIGSLADATVFSFYATKNLTTAEGGMITTNNTSYAEAMRPWILHGISRDAWKRYTKNGSWRYDVTLPGFKYNLTDLQSALGLCQLARQPEMLRQRQQLAARYHYGLSSLPEIKRPVTRPNIQHAWHLYVIRLQLQYLTINRAEFINCLHAEGIGASVHFIPLHYHTYYRHQFSPVWSQFPIANAAYKELISLPLYTRMTSADVGDVVEAITRIVKRHRRQTASVWS